MKQRHRAYASPSTVVRFVGSVITTVPIVAMGMHPFGLARGILIGTVGLGLAVQGVGFLPGEVVVGDDGVFVRSLSRRTFIPRRAIATIDYTSGKKIRIVEKSGAAHDLFMLRESGVGPIRGALAVLVESSANAPARVSAAVHDALAARALAWATAANADVARGPESAYRSDEPEEHLWEIAEDVDAQPLSRAGAVLALAPSDDAGRLRAKRVAENAAHPIVAGAFDAAARGDREGLRLAIVAGLRAPARESAGTGPRSTDGEGSQVQGVLRPPYALHALAWLSHLWLVFPILAIALRSLPLGVAAGVMGFVGALPWAAVREYDPLMRFEPGAVSEEGGFLVQNGRRLLALADVRRAFVHRRPGHPAVVRFEGRGGWVLLDARVGGAAATRAFFDALPLSEEQRTVPFSTMMPTKGFERFAIGMVAGTLLTLSFAKNLLPGYAIGTIIGLALALIRIPRFVTPQRDGLAIRAFKRTRFVRYDDVVAVERRRGAGTVVTKDGERIKLRSVEGDLSSVPDDDLTETVIDRWTDWRAAKARVRVAAEGSEAKTRSEEEEREGKKEEAEEEEKREKEEREREEEVREEEDREGEGDEKRKKRRIS